MNNPFSLEGKNILVTGASAGIGRAVALICADNGANVVIVGRNVSRLEDTYNSLTIKGCQVHKHVIADITKEEGLYDIVSVIDVVDGIVHCAGINEMSVLKYINKTKIDAMFNINYSAPLLLTKELYKRKKLANSASVVFISSISSMYATISNALYASTKGAINSLVKVLALELSVKKIRVNAISPGMVRTSMLHAYGHSDEDVETMVHDYPLGRLGTPEDIANATLYLLSNASEWVTGINLIVDGGATLR